MTDTQLRAQVLRELAQVAPEADLTQLGPEDNLRETLDIDSFDALQFIIRLHEELGVDIPESDYRRLTTLDRIVEYLAAHVA